MAVSRRRIVVGETLMCGLRAALDFVPGGSAITRAADLVERVQQRHEVLTMKEVQGRHEHQLTQFERKMRDMVQEEIQGIVTTLRSPLMTGAELDQQIRNYFAINQHGYAPAMFEGLLRNSPHWADLKRSPENYGDVLESDQALDKKKIPILIEADPLRILELKPYAFAQLLTGQQHTAQQDVRLAGASDIWVFHGNESTDTAAPRLVVNKPVIVSSSGVAPKRLQVPASAHLTRRTLDFGKGVSGEFVYIDAPGVAPAGFLMGSPDSEKERADNERQFRAKLTRPYLLQTTPVTQAQWEAVMGSNPSHFTGDPRLPVENVSWDDCQEFIGVLRKRGILARLPTEAEWEFACRAGTTTPFSFGQTISTDQANYDGNYVYGSGRKGVYRQKTTPVGSFPANPWGLHDMHGNVWEWCEDWFGAYPTGTATDPTGPQTSSHRVLRGGSWRNDPRYLRSASRYSDAPSPRDIIIGFRLSLDSK